MLMQTLNSNIVCPCAQVVAHMPQNDLLAHPQTRGFLFQGGIYSQYEAVYHGKPVVVMPFFAGAAPLWMRLKYVTSAKELRVVWTGSVRRPGDQLLSHCCKGAGLSCSCSPSHTFVSSLHAALLHWKMNCAYMPTLWLLRP